MNANELCTLLRVPRKKLKAWIDAGLPSSKRGRVLDFDAAAVRDWLLAHGCAKPRRTAVTLGEVARHFEVADRTVAYWRSRGMPGDPGGFDLDEIAAWRVQEGLARTDEDSVKTEGQKIENELKQLKLEQQRGRLIAVEPVRRLFVRHVHEAKAIFGQVPDRILAALPAAPPKSLKTWNELRLRLRDVAARLVAETCQSLADMLKAQELPADKDS